MANFSSSGAVQSEIWKYLEQLDTQIARDSKTYDAVMAAAKKMGAPIDGGPVREECNRIRDAIAKRVKARDAMSQALMAAQLLCCDWEQNCDDLKIDRAKVPHP
jgi:hypothetical protein